MNKDLSINTILNERQFEKERTYWLNRLAGDLVRTGFPYDRINADCSDATNDRGIESFNLSEEICEKALKLSSSSDRRLYMVLSTVVVALLHRYTGNEDIIIGAPIYRQKNEGEFINTAVALRNNISGGTTFKKLLLSFKQTLNEAYDNQNYPMEALAKQLKISSAEEGFHLFDTAVLLEEIHDKRYIEHLNIGMVFCFKKNNESIVCSLEYDTRHYEAATIKRIINHYKNLMAEALNNTDRELYKLAMLSEAERQQLLYTFNDTARSYPRNSTIHQLFEEQVSKTPDNIALSAEDWELTYEELNKSANRLAWYLREKGLKPEAAVGLMVRRSPAMIIGMLAILKAGGAFLPIDPKYPDSRIREVLRGAEPMLLLTEKEYIRDFSVPAIAIDDIDEVIRLQSPQSPECEEAADSLAYIMYTSGSSGKPKGTMIEHRNVVRLVKNSNYIELTEQDSILQTGAIVFDACTFEIWGALLNGARLVIVDESTILSPKKLERALRQHNITTLWLTSPLFNQLSQQNAEIFSCLKNLLVGGDALSPQNINRVRHKCSGTRIINGYGPTENTTFSICFTIDRDYNDNIPIGRPISNSTAYITDKYGNPMPIGAVGELWVGGDGLARGYLGQPGLTSQKFIPNPFEEGKRVYRTGDLARRLPDGNIEFKGRMDHQVKIRGFRIEPAEIESKLLCCEFVREAVVAAREDENGDKYLCAYFTADRRLQGLSLRAALERELPEYMIPSYFVQLEQIPLTINGKIDRGALPQPATKPSSREYRPPRSELEQKLVKIWSEIFGIDSPGIHDSFFELGGHSLKAAQMVARIYKELGIELSISEFLDMPTIALLSAYITNNRFEDYGGIDSHLILLRKGSSRTRHFFMVHDGSGDVEAYIDFCQNLSKSFNYWGIKAELPEKDSVEDITIENLAAKYIKAIKLIQPEGPYYIAGWCIGGTIAFEMVRQLEQENEKIDYLGLIDSPAPREEEGHRTEDSIISEDKLIESYLGNLRMCEYKKPDAQTEEVWQQAAARFIDQNMDRKLIKDFIPQDIINAIPNYEQIDNEELMHYFNVISTLVNARAAYKPSKQINARTYLFKTCELDKVHENKWNMYCKKPVNCYNINGNHFSIFKNPDLEEFAKIFNKAFSNIVRSKN